MKRTRLVCSVLQAGIGILVYGLFMAYVLTLAALALGWEK